MKTMPTPDPGDDGNRATRKFREGFIKLVFPSFAVSEGSAARG